MIHVGQLLSFSCLYVRTYVCPTNIGCVVIKVVKPNCVTTRVLSHTNWIPIWHFRKLTTFNSCRYFATSCQPVQPRGANDDTCCESIHVNHSKTCERCLPAKDTTIINKRGRNLVRLFVWSVIVCRYGTNCTL